MRPSRILLLTAILLANSAYATNAVEFPATPPMSGTEPLSVTAVSDQLDATPASELAIPFSRDAESTTSSASGANDVAAAEDSGEAEQDAEEIEAQPPVRDPWEGFNRKIHSFNNAADKYVLRPLAVGYEEIMPGAVQEGVSRFFANLRMPVTVVNQALQGRPGQAAQSLGRFVVNTTVGIVGVFDPATLFGMPQEDDEDLGQTLATWGWRDSRYLVLPLLGPRTVRDALAIVGDRALSPIGQIQDSGVAYGLQLMQMVDVRVGLLPVDEVRRNALDDYLFVRDAWAQRRNHQIQQDLRSNRD
jgi:phospholipid-binding lipoprotein MlaA